MFCRLGANRRWRRLMQLTAEQEMAELLDACLPKLDGVEAAFVRDCWLREATVPLRQFSVKVLRRFLKDACVDASIDECQCDRLDYALDLAEHKLNSLLPPPGSSPRARLPAAWFGDELEGGTAAADQGPAV